MTNVSQTNEEETAENGAAQGHSPAERIRDLNDELRTTGIGGTTNLTRGMWAWVRTSSRMPFRRFARSTRSAKITTRGKSTTAPRWKSTARASSSRSITTTSTWRCFRPTPPPQRHAARPDHHASGRILVSSTGTPAPHCPGARWGVSHHPPPSTQKTGSANSSEGLSFQQFIGLW